MPGGAPATGLGDAEVTQDWWKRLRTRIGRTCRDVVSARDGERGRLRFLARGVEGVLARRGQGAVRAQRDHDVVRRPSGARALRRPPGCGAAGHERQRPRRAPRPVWLQTWVDDAGNY